jgi:DNA modification methylase
MSEIKPIEYWINKIHCGDAYELLKQIPSESVDVVITSPPTSVIGNIIQKEFLMEILIVLMNGIIHFV